MQLEIAQGEKIEVTLKGTDGVFTIAYGQTALTVTSDLPDTEGRVGEIYKETWHEVEDGETDDTAPVCPFSSEQEATFRRLIRETFTGYKGSHNIFVGFENVPEQDWSILANKTLLDLDADSMEVIVFANRLEEEFLLERELTDDLVGARLQVWAEAVVKAVREKEE